MSGVCIICKEGATSGKKLINNQDMLNELVSCCKERLSLGQTDIKQLTDCFDSMSESELKSACYHSECRKPFVNKRMIERLRAQSDSLGCSTRGRGRPSSSDAECTRPKRKKSIPKADVCIFSACSFCPKDTSEPLHRVFSDKMGENLLEIKFNTQNDCVRTSVADLEDPGDASALEKYYHRKCLRSAQRTFTPTIPSNVHLINSVCDEELLFSIQNTLTADDITVNMAELNQSYISILKRYQVEVDQTANYRKHLKKVITDRLPNVQFIKSVRKNEPENLVLKTAVSKAMELKSTFFDNGDTIGHIKKVANILREEMMHHRDWFFSGTFDDFENPPILQFFLSHLLFGPHVQKVSGMRNEEVDKTVDVACQFLIQNTRSDRQVKHQPKKDGGFQQTVQTPLSIGLPLAIHSRVRDKNLVNNLSDVYIGSDYLRILDLEKRLEQGVLQRMKETGGFCLPDFVKKGVNIWFAVDNIDLLEDTPTGQNTFHGTVIVINQRAEEGESINQEVVIPQKLLTPAQLTFEVKYQQEVIIRTRPIRFGVYQLGKRGITSKDYTHTWALANYLGTDDSHCETPNDAQVANNEQEESEQQRDGEEVMEEQQGQADGLNVPHPDNPIISVTEHFHKVGKLRKEEVMPTWAATKSLLLSQSSEPHVQTNTEVIAPLFKTSPTDYRTLYTVLMLTQGISAVVVGPEKRTIITLDLDLYNRALQIQQSVGNTNWILRAGALHIVFAALHALGKTIEGSGLDTCAIESGTYTSAALRGIFNGKAYKRGIEYHTTTCLAIMMMRFDEFFSEFPSETVHEQCTALKKALHERNPDMVKIYDDIESWYSGNLMVLEEKEKKIGELAQFLLEYLKQVDSLLHLISACRSGDWEGYLAALENQIKYFFAHDLLNYARLMPVHLAQMNALEQDDPVTWDALKSGDFVVAKSEIPFCHLFTDQALEQEIKGLKRHGGMVGLSQDEAALDRLVTTTPHLARIVKQYLHSFPQASKSSERHEHYQLSGNIALRSRENALKLRHSIERHCTDNPFSVNFPLKSLVSSALVPTVAKKDILQFAEKGQKCFEGFIQDRLLHSSTVSVWDPMKKLKLKTFSNWMEKTKVRVGDKVIKLREERELFSRFLIIQQSRPELVPKLEETIGDYEMSVVPRSLCTIDGSLYIPTDKASLMHVIEGATAQQHQPDPVPQAVPMVPQTRILIVDAMAVLQSMKKTLTIKTLSDLQEAFIKRIEYMMTGFNEGRVVFDRYLDQSLKNKTRQKRVSTSTEFHIHPEMKLTMSLKELLSASKTKHSLISMFADNLLNHYASKADFKLVVVYDTKIKSHDFEEKHTHEEADTLIPHQVLASVENIGDRELREVCVWSPDTDVLILLLDLVSHGHIGHHSLKFVTGTGTRRREINVVERVQVIGQYKCQGLIGLHNFSGADWGGKFVGISKKTWVVSYMKLDENDSVINCFRELGEGVIPTELINGELPPVVKDLERFVCQVYCKTGPTNLSALRWELFRSKNLEGEMLPPTRATLLPHITRVNYIAMRDKSYTITCPALPPIEHNGWLVVENSYIPVRCLNLPAPQAVIELTKCACKTGCKKKCSCSKNGIPCTPLCKCHDSDCANVIRNVQPTDDIDE